MSALSTAPALQAQTSDFPKKHNRFNLFVETDADASALARIVNLMAKLDIRPHRFETQLDAATDRYEVRIETGTDLEQCERLKHRLEACVTVRQLRFVTLHPSKQAPPAGTVTLVRPD